MAVSIAYRTNARLFTFYTSTASYILSVLAVKAYLNKLLSHVSLPTAVGSAAANRDNDVIDVVA